MWGDSEILYLRQITSPERVKASVSRCVFFVKNSTKITETPPPLDLGSYFKGLKVFDRHITSVQTETPLWILVAIHFKELKRIDSWCYLP